MKKEMIKQLFTSFETIKQERSGVEYWSARELQALLGYSKWENFEKAIKRAMEATKNSGYDINNHFLEARRMVDLGSGSRRKVSDYSLTRYACYQKAFKVDEAKRYILLLSELQNQSNFASIFISGQDDFVVEGRVVDIIKGVNL